MSYRFELENFEGPLDLLLSLIDESKLDISQISLAKITDQYLDYIKNNDNLNIEEIADFLVIAAKLLYIKSKLLLPDVNFQDETEEDAGELERQLKIYKEYHDARKILQKRVAKKNFTYVRTTPLIKIKAEFLPPKNIELKDFKFVMNKIIDSLKFITQIPKKLIDKTINIREKIEHIQNLLNTKAKVCFSEFIKDKNNKTEIIVSFLAMLELMKQRTIDADQEFLFEEIIIKNNIDG
jgi:segregation and condensation protein A